jgi:ribosomal-protein-alanine N-acetyltransferase
VSADASWSARQQPAATARRARSASGGQQRAAAQDFLTTAFSGDDCGPDGGCMKLATAIPGCALRPWLPADIPSLVANANNRNVWRNLADVFPHPYTEEDAEEWLRVAGNPGRNLIFAIERDGLAVGGIGARAGAGIFARTAHFGYWLGEGHWGRGLATAAGRAMLDYLAADARFVRLEAPVFEWNPASMRVLEKLGFEREGILRRSVTKDGRLIDSVLFAYLFDN